MCYKFCIFTDGPSNFWWMKNCMRTTACDFVMNVVSAFVFCNSIWPLIFAYALEFAKCIWYIRLFILFILSLTLWMLVSDKLKFWFVMNVIQRLYLLLILIVDRRSFNTSIIVKHTILCLSILTGFQVEPRWVINGATLLRFVLLH